MFLGIQPVVFFFQAEDGIRDPLVTGVQTCALPIYERADILIMCLQSLEMQTVRDFEVLVIDDGSEEPLEPIVARKNLSIKPRWQLLETKNTRASAKNAGIEQAQGKIALFWDADMVADS